MATHLPTAAVRSVRVRQRRFLMLAVASLAVVGVVMGVSFLDSSGATTLSVDTSASNNFVFPVAASTSNTLPCAIANLKYTTSSGITPGTGTSCATTKTAFKTTGVVQPSWVPVAGSAGSVTGGDIAVVDATNTTVGADHTSVLVNVYVTNLDKLQAAYSSFAFPVNVYESASGTGAWTQSSSVLASVTYLTYTTGFVSFSLPKGKYYDLAFDTGGSFFCTSTTTAANLNPSFFFTAQAV